MNVPYGSLLLLILFVGTSGCVLNPCGSHYVLEQEWIEAGVYGGLPPNGTYDGYRVVHHSESEPGKERVGVGKDYDGGHIGMTIRPDGRVLLAWRNLVAIGEAETENGIRAMFVAIGVDGPHHFERAAQWNRTSTC